VSTPSCPPLRRPNCRRLPAPPTRNVAVGVLWFLIPLFCGCRAGEPGHSTVVSSEAAADAPFVLANDPEPRSPSRARVWRSYRAGDSPQKKWGPALLPAPTAPSEGSAGVRNLVDSTLRPTHPLSILAHQLRRRFLSDRSLLRGARWIYLTAPPEGSLVFRSARPAIEPKSSVKAVRCSTALLGVTTLASRFAHRSSEKPQEPRRARGNFLFRRLFPADPE